jgi:ATP-binding protein involved in chromosome partitioning
MFLINAFFDSSGSIFQGFIVLGVIIGTTIVSGIIIHPPNKEPLFRKFYLKILYRSMTNRDDGKKYAIFGEGGVKKTAEEFEKEFLGEIPINPEVGIQGDNGVPIVEGMPDHNISKIYLEISQKIKSKFLS